MQLIPGAYQVVRHICIQCIQAHFTTKQLYSTIIVDKNQIKKTKLEKTCKLHKTPTEKLNQKLVQFTKPEVPMLRSSIPGQVIRLLHPFYNLLDQPKSQSQKENHSPFRRYGGHFEFYCFKYLLSYDPYGPARNFLGKP